MYQHEFETWLKEEGLASLTIRSYVRTLHDFIEWYIDTTGEDFNPSEIRSLDVQDFRKYLERGDAGKGRKPNTQVTINKKIAALKTYWNFLLETNRCNINPMVKVKLKTIAVNQMAPRWLTKREQARFLESFQMERKDETDQQKWRRIRDYAIAQCMLQGGLRISEVVALDLSDLDLKHKRHETMTIRYGKGNKRRYVPINKDLLEALNAWLEVRGNGRDKEAVFLSQWKKRMSTRMIRETIEHYFRIANIPEAVPHSLRHTCAKNMIDSGEPIGTVKRYLGHENIATTERYTLPSMHDLRKASEAISSRQ